MAKAIREFVAAMKFSPTKKGPNPNIELAGLVLAMLQHCHGLQSGATVATCSPSYAQLAELLHCGEKTIQRLISRLVNDGLITTQRRGHNSNSFTIHQTGQQLSTQQTGQQLSTRNRTTHQTRPDNSTIQTGQLAVQTGQQLSYIGVKPQGLSQEKQSQGKGPESGSSFSQTKPLTALEMARERQRRAAEAL